MRRKWIILVFVFLMATALLPGPACAQNSCTLVHTFPAGYSVAAAGDVDQDSVPDIIVGEPTCTKTWCINPADHRGHAYVYSGKNHSLLYTFTGWVSYAPGLGDSVGSELGISVAGAGDVNKDGFDDLIVGASIQYLGLPGHAYVYSGRDGSILYDLHPENIPDAFGAAVANAGDVNKDGYPDLIVGAPVNRSKLSNDANPADTGRAYVFSGQDGSVLYRLTGEQPQDLFGFSVTGLGDVDGDGYADFAAGSPWYRSGTGYPDGDPLGRVYVYSGKNGTILYITDDVYGPVPQATPWYGWSVAGAGDVNGDTIPDLVVGAMQTIYTDPYPDYSGAVFVYSGRDGALIYRFLPPATAPSSGDFWFGSAVSGAGDLNRDGFADIVVGSAQSKVGVYLRGRVYVFSGRTGDVLRKFDADSSQSWLGWSVAGVGDMDSDEVPELLLGTVKRHLSVLYSCPCGNDMNFRASTDGWQFGNTQANMWPQSWWQQFDYTAAQYPYWLRAWARSSDFPSWPRFVDAFGDSQCYWDPPPGRITYRLKSLTRWLGIKGNWGGSCFGFAVSSLLYFDDSLLIPVDFPGYLLTGQVPIGNESRRIVNTYWIHQFGRIAEKWIDAHWNDTPRMTVRECLKMFCDPNNPHRALTLFNNHGHGGHGIVPYRIAPDSHSTTAVDIFVYDNVYPSVDTLKVIVDTLANVWSYSGLPGWGGSKYLLLENPVGDYMTRPVLTSAYPGIDPPVKLAAGVDNAPNLIECFLTPSDTAVLASPFGTIGRLGDSLFNTLVAGYPIVPLTGHETPPIGYAIPNGNWSVRTIGVSDPRLRMSFFTDSMVLVYSRDSAAAADADSICYRGFDSSLCVYNVGDSVRLCNIELLAPAADSDLFCRLTAIGVGPFDSSLFALGGHDDVLIRNFGSATTYNLRVEAASAAADTVFYHGFVPLSGHTTHDILLDWRSHGGQIPVLVDSGMTGTFADTMRLANTGESACPCVCRADPECDGVIDVRDIIRAVDVAFRMLPNTSDPDPQCTYKPTDVDCDGVTNLVDVVKLIDVVFRGGNPAVNFCPPCGL